MDQPPTPHDRHSASTDANFQTPPIIQWLALSIFIPITLIRGPWRKMTAGHAYLAHLYGVGLASAGLALGDLSYNNSLILAAMNGDGYAAEQVVSTAVQFVIFIEFAYLFAAFATMCWGAGPEPWSKSYAQSIKRWWQLTPCHAALSLVFLAVASVFEETLFNQSYYLAGALLLGLLSLGHALLLVYTTLRSLAIHELKDGWPASCRWPLVCEGCGYTLVGLATSQSCPECGRSIAQSIDSGRGRLAQFRPYQALLRCMIRPTFLGQSMLTRRPETNQGSVMARGIAVLLISAPICAAVAFVIVFVFTILMEQEVGSDLLDPQVVAVWAIVSLYSAAAMAIGMTGLALLLASIYGSLYALIHKRNVLHLAGQAVAYTSAFLPIWALGNWVTLGALAWAFSYFFFGPTPDWIALIPLAWLSFNLLCLVAYLVLLSRTIRGTRWANV